MLLLPDRPKFLRLFTYYVLSNRIQALELNRQRQLLQPQTTSLPMASHMNIIRRLAPQGGYGMGWAQTEKLVGKGTTCQTWGHIF